MPLQEYEHSREYDSRGRPLSHGAKLRTERRGHEEAMENLAHEHAMAQERLRQKGATARAAMQYGAAGGGGGAAIRRAGGGLSAGGGGAGGEGGWEPPPVRGPSRYETEELKGGGTRTYDWIGGQGREGGLRPRMGEGGRWMTASTGEQGTEDYREYKVWQRDRPKPPMSPEMVQARTGQQALEAEIEAKQQATRLNIISALTSSQTDEFGNVIPGMPLKEAEKRANFLLNFSRQSAGEEPKPLDLNKLFGGSGGDPLRDALRSSGGAGGSTGGLTEETRRDPTKSRHFLDTGLFGIERPQQRPPGYRGRGTPYRGGLIGDWVGNILGKLGKARLPVRAGLRNRLSGAGGGF